MIRRGRITTAQFRRDAKVGDRIQVSWMLGLETVTREFIITNILPASEYNRLGREFWYRETADFEHLSGVFNEFSTGDRRFALVG